MADRRPAGLEAQICSYVTLTFRTCRTEPVLFRTVTSRQLGPTAVVGRLETVAPPCAYRARRRRPGKAEGPSRAGPDRGGKPDVVTWNEKEWPATAVTFVMLMTAAEAETPIAYGRSRRQSGHPGAAGENLRPALKC